MSDDNKTEKKKSSFFSNLFSSGKSKAKSPEKEANNVRGMNEDEKTQI